MKINLPDLYLITFHVGEDFTTIPTEERREADRVFDNLTKEPMVDKIRMALDTDGMMSTVRTFDRGESNEN